jgi:lambda family phage portal protein
LLEGIRNLIARKTTDLAPSKMGAEYMRGGRGIVFSNWNPSLRSAQDEVTSSWDKASARTIDTIHNSGWIAGAIDQAVANTVGVGLRLKAAPESEAFGMDEKSAREWARKVEQRFGLWANNKIECDIEGRRTFGQMQAAMLRSYFATGEAFAEIPWKKRLQFGTKMRMIPSHRVSRKDDSFTNVVQGVRMDNDGFPLGYTATKKDRILGEIEWDVPAFDAMWRPRVVHCFDGMPGQVRGITPLVPALRVCKQYDQLSDATLTASIIQTVFAATIKSEMPTEEAMQGLLTPQEQAKMAAAGTSVWDAWFSAQSGWYDKATFDVGINGRFAHLFPGQELEFQSAQHPSSDYKDFALHLLREIARCLGLTYESATGDYDGATYSSVRMATGEIFPITLYRRAYIIAPACQAGYEAWLEEDIETGGTPFPGGIAAFHAQRSAVCRAFWRGSPKPQADDVKTATAHQIWRDMGVLTDEMIANDLGTDIEDVYVQRAREAEMRQMYGLKDAQEREDEARQEQLEAAKQDALEGPKDQPVKEKKPTRPVKRGT